ncbi:hypothetical protein BCR37DRAFT_380273 [Protomyces lactucae-debilis]|uniref:Class E vacuolar protein-sorting machinery protein HSE1 n=1 Tax=Protomyces lactucae-debilis TaxID=2754530 RepID=A0A1Y2FBV1_PROLT|nr:uncharacterized protein BCR37DRAFT_380273 [Protomyces lactucae-debilis]ORY81388.1 hypothetical protein BCR37DRAFT_380273 [Protomyces lactucae-debilis]
MFSRSQANPMDDIVTKATDENLTTENWEAILAVCDKVDADPQDGARHAVAAVQKRLGHRNANVQLYALSLAEALSKNCGSKVHRELASRSFTQTLLGLVNDRTLHGKVKARTVELVKQWCDDFKHDSSLGIMSDTYRAMQAQGIRVQAPSKPQKTEISEQDRRREEEELQMALAMSLTETHISSHAGGGSGSGTTGQHRNQVDAGPNAYTLPAQTATSAYTLPTLSQQSSQAISQPQQQQQQLQQQAHSFQETPVAERTAATVSRVRALYDFAASEPGELTFHRGDVITVIESAYKDWWRGSLRGTVGIFPTNYVENLPEPTQAELQREAEEERRVFAEAKNVEKLLSILSSADVHDPAIAENDALQQLYHTTIAIRPKLVRLIEKYSQRKDDLILLNDKFVKARKDYDELMEASLSRYQSGAYRQPPLPQQHSGGQGARYGPPPGRGASGPPGGYQQGPPSAMQAQHSGPPGPGSTYQHGPPSGMQGQPAGPYGRPVHHGNPDFSPQQQQRPSPQHAPGSTGSVQKLQGMSPQQQQQQQQRVPSQPYQPGVFTTRPSDTIQHNLQHTPYPVDARGQASQGRPMQPALQIPTSPSQELSQAFPPTRHSDNGLSSELHAETEVAHGSFDQIRFDKEGGPPIAYYAQAPEGISGTAAELDDESGEGSPVDAYGAVQNHARQSQTSLKQQGTGPSTNPWSEQPVRQGQGHEFYEGLGQIPAEGQHDQGSAQSHPQGPSNPEDYYR